MKIIGADNSGGICEVEINKTFIYMWQKQQKYISQMAPKIGENYIQIKGDNSYLAVSRHS